MDQIRFTGRCVNNSLPMIPVKPIELREAKRAYGKNLHRIEMKFDGLGSDYLDNVQIIRKTEAVVANAEARFEINDNEIVIPMVTASKLRIPKTDSGYNFSAKNYISKRPENQPHILEGMMVDIWKVKGEIEENIVEGEELLQLYSYVAANLALYDRCLQMWSSYLPGSCFYQDFTTVFDWGGIEDGNFIPKGVPLSPKKCRERFYEILEKMNISVLKGNKFDQITFEAVVEILKIGKSAFPGLVIRQPELDMFVKATLKSALIETIESYTQGKGKITVLEQIWRELKDFGKLSLIKNEKFAPRPLSAVYTAESTPGSAIQVLDLINVAVEGASRLTKKAAVRLNIQTRSMVRNHMFFFHVATKLICHSNKK